MTQYHPWYPNIAAWNALGHYICAKERRCLKCNHSSIELRNAHQYIPCLDEIPEAEPIPEPKSLATRTVEALESIGKAIKDKDFRTDLHPVIRSLEQTKIDIIRSLPRRR